MNQPGILATSDNSPSGLIKKWHRDFEDVLPSHIPPRQWISAAASAVKADPKLMEAANNDPLAFGRAIKKAATLGLMPGTDEFYLVPKAPRQGAKPIINGWTGWQGLVELMLRAGAASSVIAELVYTGDKFTYVIGRDERPIHEVDWDAPERGDLRLAYAYAIMKDGATSKVVVMNRAEIEGNHKSRAMGTDRQSSPWNTDEAAMWRKTVVRELAKWVPTSAEYRREQLRAAQEVWEERNTARTVHLNEPVAGQVNTETGEVPMDDQPLEGELLD